jgi:hypothetical protein
MRKLYSFFKDSKTVITTLEAQNKQEAIRKFRQLFPNTKYRYCYVKRMFFADFTSRMVKAE